MTTNQRILVFIPMYRCEVQIRRVLEKFDDQVQSLVDTVIVVDNRSPDDTLAAAIDSASKQFKKTNFVAWRNSENYGLGGSHKAAFRYAIENEFDYVVVLHGDDQADIRDLVPYLEKNAHAACDCFLGARFMPNSKLQNYSKFREIGNRVYNLLFSFVALQKIHDLGSGLNMYRADFLKDYYYKKFPDDLTFNYVMLLASYYRGQKVAFFPISWREEDQISNVKLFRQSFKVLKLLAAFSIFRGFFLRQDMRRMPIESYVGTIEFSDLGKSHAK